MNRRAPRRVAEAAFEAPVGSGRYAADMDILVHDGEKPQENPDAYDAFSVISQLQPKILAGGS